MKELSYLEKSKLPYSLLLDPETGRAAAYTNNHQLIVEEASQALLEFARTHTDRQAAYDPAKQDPSGMWRPLPAWATPVVLPRLLIVWIKRPMGDADDEWRAIPER